jgi:diguanylate cyclase (GGDEF)-like protein
LGTVSVGGTATQKDSVLATLDSAGPTRRRRLLVWLLVILSAVALATAAMLAFAVLPHEHRMSAAAIDRMERAIRTEELFTEQASVQREVLLTGDPALIDEFEQLRRLFVAALTELRANLDRPEQAKYDAAKRAYDVFLADHDKVVAAIAAGHQQDAVDIGLGQAKQSWLEAETQLHALHEGEVAAVRKELDSNATQSMWLTGLLLVLSLAPALATFSLGRAFRRIHLGQLLDADRQRLAEAQRVAKLGSWENDLRTGQVTWSDQLYRLFGFEPGATEPSMSHLVDRCHPDDREGLLAFLGQPPSSEPFSYVNRIVWPSGEVRWMETQGEFTLAEDGTPLAIVGIGIDVTERETAAASVRDAQDKLGQQEATMRHRAYHDALTGLPNRALLLERMERALAEHDGAGDRGVAVLLIDLDGFKRVNDSLGHGIGDQLLVRVAERLARGVRGLRRPDGVDPRRVPDTVARLGGDEFAVLLADSDAERARAVAERVLHECEDRFAIDGRELDVAASIGVAVASSSWTPAELLRNADVAMYAAKEAGGSRMAMFDPEMHTLAVERLAIEADLRSAIADRQLTLHYQPIVDAVTRRVTKVEALVRWEHPTRGMLPPDRFIPLAEETGLIVPLGAWVLAEACREIAAYGNDLEVAVNLSARQLDEPGFPATVSATLLESGLAPERLVLEITESVVMAHDASAFAVLDELRGLGVSLAIDDFGTGYSSLSRLRAMPVAEIKIDKSFIDDVDESGGRAPIVAAVIALAHGLGRQVVAEGVETAHQLAALDRLGCDFVQGYLFSRPLPSWQLAELLAMPVPFPDIEAAAEIDTTASLMDAVVHAVEPHGEEATDDLVRSLLVELSRLTNLESTYVTSVDLARGEQHVLVANNAGDLEIPEDFTLPWRDTLCQRALAHGPRATASVPRDLPGSPGAEALGVRTYAMAPVTRPDGELLGTLCAASTSEQPVDENTVALLDVFAKLIADALDERFRVT